MDCTAAEVARIRSASRRLLAAASLALSVTCSLTLLGCSSTSLDQPGRTSNAAAGAASASAGLGSGPAGGSTSGGSAGEIPAQSRVATVDLAANLEAAKETAASQRVIYFDYDSFAIKDEYQAMLVAHAKVLAANPKANLLIEGHTDERGGSEYNLALGEKRAEAVRRVLILLGAPAKQMEAVSLGAEHPAVEGHDEAAWAKNRRAELKDR